MPNGTARQAHASYFFVLTMSTPDPLHPFDVGDLVVTTTPLTVGHMDSTELCPAGETLQVVGLSGNALYPISVCRPNDPFWRVAVLPREIHPQSLLNRNPKN